jgi:hypothetical protein
MPTLALPAFGRIPGLTQEIRLGRDVPVYTESGPIDPLTVSEWADRPPVLLAATGSFAIWISRIRGRLRPGDLAFVRAAQPARIGDTVVVLKGKSVVVIGDLVSLDPDTAAVQEAAGASLIVDRGSHRILKVACINPA